MAHAMFMLTLNPVCTCYIMACDMRAVTKMPNKAIRDFCVHSLPFWNV